MEPSTASGSEAVALRREQRHTAYEQLRNERPSLFVNPPGTPIEILHERADQDMVADAAARDYASLGIPTENADIGIVYEDRFIRVVRDAVRFRSGQLGPYVRVMNAVSAAGCAVLPVTEDSRIILVSHFRHESRRWHWEIPRGFGDAGETPAETAGRELREELGLHALRLEWLGPLDMQAAEPDELFLARVHGEPSGDREEGIDQVRFVAYEQLVAEIASGEISDAYTLAALARAIARGLLPA